MYEGSPYDFGADFSGLAEPPPPERPKTPEFFNDDDDDEDADAEPKTIRDYFEKQDEEKAEESQDEVEETEEQEPEPEDDQETDEESDEADPDDIEAGGESAEMTAEEEQTAAVEIIEARQQENNESTDEGSANTEVEDAAAEDFLETAKQEIESGQPVDEALETAKAKTLEDIGVETEQPEPESRSTEEEPDAEAELEAPVVETAELPPVVEAQEPEEDVIPPTDPAATVPPAGPLPPIPPGGGIPGMPAPPSHDVLPPTPITATETKKDTVEDRRRIGHPLLVGGIIGYMIGRRRGRIKTEKELLPIQHKLEKEVTALQEKIFWHEASVRTLAHAKAVENPEAAKRAAERLQEKKQESKQEANSETNPENNQEKIVEQKTAAAQSERLGLGKLAVEAEEPSRPEVFRPESLKPVEAMTVPELLVVAAQIQIEQSTIRRLHESGRLNDEGLRRIVSAYLRGERYDELLRENLVSPEKYAYSETLTHNGTNASQDNPYAIGQNAGIYGSTQPGQTVNPAQSPSQTPDYWGYPQAKSSQNYTAIIVVGIIIAVIIVAFVFIG